MGSSLLEASYVYGLMGSCTHYLHVLVPGDTRIRHANIFSTRGSMGHTTSLYHVVKTCHSRGGSSGGGGSVVHSMPCWNLCRQGWLGCLPGVCSWILQQRDWGRILPAMPSWDVCGQPRGSKLYAMPVWNILGQGSGSICFGLPAVHCRNCLASDVPFH
jgi:hypothetical protein